MIIACALILAAVLLSALGGARAKARDSRRVTDVRQIQEALRLYFNDCNSYPAQSLILSGQSLSSGETSCKDGGWQRGGGGVTYMPEAPSAPEPADGSCTEIQNQYTYSGAGSSYALSFCLGGEVESYAAGQQIVP